MKAYRLPAKDPLWVSGACLVLANALPLAGTLFWEWRVLDLAALYWAENLVIGAYAILRIAAVDPGTGQFAGTAAKLAVIPFFVLHYGMFCLVHGFILFAVLGEGRLSGIATAGTLLGGNLGWALVALTVSHGVSFFWNYLGKNENRDTTMAKQMREPYPRLAVLHIAILLGAFAIQAAGQPLALLVVLVVGKTAVDLKLHVQSHRKKRKKRPPEPRPVPEP
ncbi:MAG: DUF6498-containing protein [Verrucomicrobiales bacterium]